MKNVLKWIVIAIVIFSGLFWYYQITKENTEDMETEIYTYDFDDIDKSAWMVGEWGSNEPDYSLAEITNGIIKLKTTETIPYMRSKPFEVKNGDVISIKRKLKIEYAENALNAGTILYSSEYENGNLIPQNEILPWGESSGNAIVLVEYVHNFNENQERPGKDVFRLLAPDWEVNNNYVLIEPIFDEWFEEEIIFDTRSNKTTYTINGEIFRIYSSVQVDDSMRIMMHPFGNGWGNSMEIDYIEIKIEHTLR